MAFQRIFDLEQSPGVKRHFGECDERNLMRKLNPLYPTGFVLLLTVLACSTATPVVVPTQQPIDVNTVIVQTAAVALSQTAAAQPAASLTFTPQATFTATIT